MVLTWLGAARSALDDVWPKALRWGEECHQHPTAPALQLPVSPDTPDPQPDPTMGKLRQGRAHLPVLSARLGFDQVCVPAIREDTAAKEAQRCKRVLAGCSNPSKHPF